MKIDDKNIESNVIVLQKLLNSYSAMNISVTPVTIFCFFFWCKGYEKQNTNIGSVSICFTN